MQRSEIKGWSASRDISGAKDSILARCIAQHWESWQCLSQPNCLSCAGASLASNAGSSVAQTSADSFVGGIVALLKSPMLVPGFSLAGEMTSFWRSRWLGKIDFVATCRRMTWQGSGWWGSRHRRVCLYSLGKIGRGSHPAFLGCRKLWPGRNSQRELLHLWTLAEHSFRIATVSGAVSQLRCRLRTQGWLG